MMVQQDNLKSKTVSAVAWKFMERFGGQAVTVVVTIVMARLLTPSEYGVVAVVAVFTSIAGIFVQSGLNTALVQNPHTSDEDYSTVFWLSASVAAVFFALMFLLAPAASEFYAMPDLCWPMRALALTLFLNAYNSVQVAKVTRDLELRKVFFATMSAVLASGAAGIALALLGCGVWALVGQQLVSSLASCVALAAQVRWRPRRAFSAPRARELFSFGSLLMLSSLCYAVYQNAADLIIGKVFDSAQLGLVSTAKRWPTAILSALDSTVRSVMLSTASKVQDDVERVKRVARRSIQLISYLVVPVMACLALVAYPLTVLLIGEQWAGAVPFMQMYCVYCAMRGFSGANGEVVSALGRSDIYLKSDVIQMVLGLSLLAAASFALRDLYAMVASYIVTRVAITLYGYFQVRRLVGYGAVEWVRDFGPAYALSAAAAAAAYPVSLLGLPLPGWLVAQGAAFFAVYLALSALFRVEAFGYLLATAKEALSGGRGTAGAGGAAGE